jgi:hypothetical protein
MPDPKESSNGPSGLSVLVSGISATPVALLVIYSPLPITRFAEPSAYGRAPTEGKHPLRPPTAEPPLHAIGSRPFPAHQCFRGFEEHNVFLVVLSNDRQAVVSDRV